MGLQTTFVQAFGNLKRSLRILWMKLILILRLVLIPFSNYNTRKTDHGIPHPAYYNSWSDVQSENTISTLFRLFDMSSHLQQDEEFRKEYSKFEYDLIVKSYFPTKVSAMESINIYRTWKYSYWNPKNDGNFQAYKTSDVLFADMMTNTQGIYKVQKVKVGTQISEKCIKFFSHILQKNIKYFEEAEEEKNIIDSLIEKGKLYYVDYPELRQIQNNRDLRGQDKFSTTITSIIGEEAKVFIEIPFAIYGQVKGYSAENKKEFLCLASVFNDTFQKKYSDINDVAERQIFHTFTENMHQRDRWQMAKLHMACTDTNDFTIRSHLGFLHYGSAIYTTAFYNLSKSNKSLQWIEKEFVNIFSEGILQVNFLSDKTLIDKKYPMAEKVFYLDRKKSIQIIKSQNAKFNIMEFDPQHIGSDSYPSDSVVMSKAYYKKLETYIDYLFEKYESSWKGSTEKMGQFLLDQLKDKEGKFDGLPNEIAKDPTESSLKILMTNLAYLWVVYHGETFSLLSVANAFYFVPPCIRKPLRQFPENPLSNNEKQQWLPPEGLIKDSMTLHKVVTFRTNKKSIISAWNFLKIDRKIWSNLIQKKMIKDSNAEKEFEDFWNDVTLEHAIINTDRTKRGLYNLHWLMPDELPITLNT